MAIMRLTITLPVPRLPAPRKMARLLAATTALAVGSIAIAGEHEAYAACSPSPLFGPASVCIQTPFVPSTNKPDFTTSFKSDLTVPQSGIDFGKLPPKKKIIGAAVVTGLAAAAVTLPFSPLFNPPGKKGKGGGNPQKTSTPQTVPQKNPGGAPAPGVGPRAPHPVKPTQPKKVPGTTTVPTPQNKQSGGSNKTNQQKKQAKQRQANKRRIPTKAHQKAAAHRKAVNQQKQQAQSQKRKKVGRVTSSAIALLGQGLPTDQSVDRGIPPGALNRRGNRLSKKQKTLDPFVPPTQVHQLPGQNPAKSKNLRQNASQSANKQVKQQNTKASHTHRPGH
jgi:hypothetical protein